MFSNSYTNSYSVLLHKYDYDTLRNKDSFEFETWIIDKFGGTANEKQRGDFGLDGKMQDNTPIQVKRSDDIGRNVIDNFQSAIRRFDNKLFNKNVKEKKAIGYIIAFSFGKGAVQEVARLKLEENIIIELIKVSDIVPIAIKPKLKVEINELKKLPDGKREIEIIAVGDSETGIEFYTWDYDYDEKRGFNAGVYIDKIGKQVLKLEAGVHKIAVIVVDNDGLENMEVIKLKINGKTIRS